MDMKIEPNDPPRVYEVGWGDPIQMKDCGRVHLQPDEQLTFMTEAGAEYDVARKDWGFYATPSLNARLTNFGLRPVLVVNRIDRYFVLLVEQGHEPEFEAYVASEDLRITAWLDDPETLAKMEAALAG
jgi:hypothetical protein